jgi:hypothetical protein
MAFSRRRFIRFTAKRAKRAEAAKNFSQEDEKTEARKLWK